MTPRRAPAPEARGYRPTKKGYEKKGEGYEAAFHLDEAGAYTVELRLAPSFGTEPILVRWDRPRLEAEIPFGRWDMLFETLVRIGATG